MTDEGRRRVRERDYTEPMTRPHVLSRYGPGKDDKLPARVRPTNQQAMIALGFVLGVGAVGWRYALSGRVPLFTWWSWLLLWTAAAAVVAPLWHKKPFDERNLARTVQSIGGHRVRSRGRSVGPWTVHGVAYRNARRPSKRPKATFVPAQEGG